METIRLELTREQATAVMDAAELLARLHIWRQAKRFRRMCSMR